MREITDVGKVTANTPRYFYRINHDSQGEYIKRKCKDSGLAVVTVGSSVAIFSKRKVPLFSSIIGESEVYPTIEHPVMQGPTLLCKDGRKVLGVFFNRGERVDIVTTDKHFPDIKYFVFTRKLPTFQFSKIFSSHSEMIQYLEEVERVLV